MTAWQDQPPISRRQVRQNERNDAVVTSSVDAQKRDETPPASVQQPDSLPRIGEVETRPQTAAPRASDTYSSFAAPTEPGFEGFGREGWDAAVRRSTFESTAAAQSDGRPNSVQRDEALQGRRANSGRVDALREVAGAEPLLYATQARPSTPHYDGGSFRDRVGEPAAEDQAKPADDNTEASPSRRSDANGPAQSPDDFRIRDFSPEGRRSSFTATVPAPETTPAPSSTSVPLSTSAPLSTSLRREGPTASADSDFGSDFVGERLDYQTMGADRLTASKNAAESDDAAAGNAALGNTVQPPVDATGERPKTRRELRALEQAGVLAPLEVARDNARADIPRLRARIRNTGTDTDQIRTDELENALAEYDALASRAAEVQATLEVAAAESSAVEVAAAVASAPPVAQNTSAVDEAALAPTSTPTVFPLIEPGPFGFASTSTAPSPIILPASVLPASVEVVKLDDSGQGSALPEVPRTEIERLTSAPEAPVETYIPPVGHWSTQALIDDDEQFQENTLSRNIGSTSGAITASSIVMPSVPSVDDILSPLGSTGEILITGSISLPSSLGHTGAVPALYDHSDVDALLAEDDREDYPNTDSAPVRAIRAVSTNTSSGAVITTGMPKGNTRLPLILTIAAAGMAALIVALTIAAFATGLF